MMQGNSGRQAVGVAVAVCLGILIGCGGDDGNTTTTLGLFPEPAVSASVQPVSDESGAAALFIPKGQVSETLATKQLSTQEGVPSPFYEALSMVVQGGLSDVHDDTVTKAATPTSSVKCKKTSETSGKCVGTAPGPLGGTVAIDMELQDLEPQFDALATDHASGKMTFLLTFSNYTGRGLCGKEVRVSGLFGCDIAFETHKNGADVDVQMHGPCNTARDPDLLLDVAIAGITHRIGYDLVLNVATTAKKIAAKSTEGFTLEGIVAIDGVNHHYGDLETALLRQCK